MINYSLLLTKIAFYFHLTKTHFYNTEPDLIRMFEIEGAGAIEENIRAAACWLYRMSFEEDLISEK